MGSNPGLAIFFLFFSPKWDKKWVLAWLSFGECTARVKLELTDFSGFDDPTNGIFQKCTSSYFRHPNWKFALGAGLRALNALTYLMLQGREGTASLILMYYRCHTPQTSNLLQCSGCCHCQPSKKIGSKTEASQIATTAPKHSIGDKKRSWRLGDIVNSQPKPMCLCFDSGFKAFLMSHVYLILF